MTKIRKISNFQYTFSFKSPEENFNTIYTRFLNSKLGMIYQAIPWQELVEELDIQESAKGPECIFSPRGKLALMFLKHYSGCSDERLIEQLNGNVHYQIFCDLLLAPEETIDNIKIVSQIRCELAQGLEIHTAQKTLAEKWLPHMEELNHATTDASCYESEIRHPTDQKLLWECVEWSYGQMALICKYLKIRKPRTKYLKWKERYFAYSRKRRKPSKERIVLTRALLHLLNKLNGELDELEQEYSVELPQKYYRRRDTIRKVYYQQYHQFTDGEKPTDRIVSIFKSYIRPIVRGKETKKVEFGAKVNKVQIDGINFIEHLSFNAFNDCHHCQNKQLHQKWLDLTVLHLQFQPSREVC